MVCALKVLSVGCASKKLLPIATSNTECGEKEQGCSGKYELSATEVHYCYSLEISLHIHKRSECGVPTLSFVEQADTFAVGKQHQKGDIAIGTNVLQCTGMKYLKRLKVEFVKGEYKNPIKGQVREPEQVFSVFKDIKDSTKEILIGVYLNDELEMNSYSILSIGTDSASLVPTDEIFRNAILTNSRNIILVHNHPSGSVAPSDEDLTVLRMLQQQGSVLNRRLLDFIIVGNDRYWSMFEEYLGDEYHG